MSNISYEESGMEMPEPHTIPNEKQYHGGQDRDDAEYFDTAMDEHAPITQDTLQNGDALIRGILNHTVRPSGSNRKRSSRGVASHSTSAPLSTANSTTLIVPASPSDASSHNDHVRHAGSSAIDGATHGTPIVDDITKLISRLATEVSKMREQLRFVKTQHEGAIEEISKAQDIINSLDEERGRAIDEARREREKVRVLEEEIKLKEAREAGYEAGRKLGMEEGLKRGGAEGKRYGGEDGGEAELERQRTAMRDQIEYDEVYEPRLPRERHEESSEPREIYNRVGDEILGLSRSRSLNINPPLTPVVTVDLQTQTANVIGFPLLQTGNPTATTYPPTVPASPSGNVSAPLGNREQPNHRRGPPNYGAVLPHDNPNINILSVFDIQTPAPAKINTPSDDRDGGGAAPKQQRSWGGGIIDSGPGGTNGTTGTGTDGAPRTTGHASVTPPSASTLDRGAPRDQYGILGDGGNYGGSLIGQVTEMTPIMEAHSEPGPSPAQAYFQDTSTSVRSPQAEIVRRERERREKEQRDAEERARYERERLQQRQQSQRWTTQQPPLGLRYVPRQRRMSQPSPTVPIGPGGANDWRRRSPPLSTSTNGTLDNDSSRGFGQRKAIPGVSVQPPNGRTRGSSINTPQDHGRAASPDMNRGSSASVARPGTLAAGGHSFAPIEIFPGTPPEQANARSTKMAQAGPNLMGSPAFVTRDTGYGVDPGATGGSGREAGGSRMKGGSIHHSPHGTPVTSPRPLRSALITGGASRNDYVENKPSGGPYRASSRQQQHGTTRQGQSQTGAYRRRVVSFAAASDHGHYHHSPPSPSRFSTEPHDPSYRSHLPPPSPPLFQSTNPAQPTPRHAVNALDMSPEQTMPYPNDAILYSPVQPYGTPYPGNKMKPPLFSPDTMYEPHLPTAAVMPNTSTAWGHFGYSGQSLAPLGPLSNGGPVLYPSASSAYVPPGSYFGYPEQGFGPLNNGGLASYSSAPPTYAPSHSYFGYPEQSLGPFNNGGFASYHSAPPTYVPPRSHFGYPEQTLNPLGPLSNGGLALYHSAPPATAPMPTRHLGYSGQGLTPLGPLNNGGLALYQSAPPTTAAMPNTPSTWGYVRDSGQSLGPLGNGGLAFSVGGSAANQMAM